MTSSGVAITFEAREHALEPVAVVGLGQSARPLAERLLRLDDERLGLLRGVAGTDIVVVLGEQGDLPWVDGCVYLGRESTAPRLLLPTTARPSVAAALFEQAVLLRWPELASPIAVLSSPPRTLSVADALPIRRSTLQAWLEVG